MYTRYLKVLIMNNTSGFVVENVDVSRKISRPNGVPKLSSSLFLIFCQLHLPVFPVHLMSLSFINAFIWTGFLTG